MTVENSLLFSLCFAGAATAAFATTDAMTKPDAFVEYIQTTGKEILDTGVPARTGVKARGKMRWTNYWEGWACYLGAESGTSKQFYMMNRHNANAWLGYGSTSEAAKIDGEQLVFDDADIMFTADYSDPLNANVSVNGHQVFVANAGETFDTGCSLTLFGARTPEGFGYVYPARCYGLTIWLDGKVIRDFKPCVKNGKGALYDRIHDEIVFPEGDLTATSIGPEVENRGYAVTEFAEPDYYVEYLKADAKQYLDTGVPACTGVKAQGKMSWYTAYNGWVCFLGSEYGSGALFHMLFRQGSAAYLDYGNQSYAVEPGGTAFKYDSSPTTYEFVSDCSDPSALSLELNGQRVFSGSYTGGKIDARRNLTLFACQTSSGISYNGQPTACYYLKLWLGGELIRDFVPCVKNGKGALYDRLLGEIVYPTGDITGSGIGPEIEDPDAVYVKRRAEYIESDGTQFIDTLVQGGSGIKMEADIEWTDPAGTPDSTFCGAQNGNTRFFLFHNYGGRVCYGYGAWKESSATCSRGERHFFVCELDAGAQNIWKDGVQIVSAMDSAEVDTASLYLFANHLDGAAKQYSKAKCWGVKIWQKDEKGAYRLVRDLRPYRIVRPGFDALGAFYDNVSKKMFRGHSQSGSLADFKACGKPGLILTVQ